MYEVGTDPARVQLVLATDLRAGDLVTEVGTKTGPWYSVLRVADGHIVVDVREIGDQEPVPLPLLVRDTDAVLRIRP